MREKTVFVIVLNWNGKNDTLECLQSLQKTNYPNFKILVVDNGSTDDSVYAIKTSFPKVEVLETGENLGFAGGNNVGITYAYNQGADYIFLLNNDTSVKDDFISILVATGESDKQIGLIGSKIYYFDHPTIIWFAGGKITGLKGVHLGLNQEDSSQFNQTKEVDYLTGCALMIKREVIAKIGTLTEDYFLYYEDTDYSAKAKKAGFKIVYEPRSIIYHKVSRSTKAGSISYIYYSIRNGLVNARRNGTVFIKCFAYVFAILLFIKQYFKIIFVPKERANSKIIQKAICDFLTGSMGPLKINTP